MKLQLNPNAWSCLPVSFAMVLDVSVEEIIKQIGHDGSEKPYPNSEWRAGFHIQECIDVVFSMGYSVTMIEANPQLIPSLTWSGTPRVVQMPGWKSNEERLQDYLHYFDGVRCGYLKSTKVGHAVAWESLNKRVYDPRGKIYEKHEDCGLITTHFLIVQRK